MNKTEAGGFRTLGLFGKKPVIGLTMFVIGSLIFIILAYNLVYSGPLIKWDLPIAKSLHALALKSPAFVTDIMIAGYYIGGTWGIIIIGLILGLYSLYKRFWRELVMVVVGFGGSGILFLILSNIFNRPRPSSLFDKLIWSGNLTIPGFPSGHTLCVTVLIGFLVYLLLPKIKSYLGKALLVLIALLVAVYIGFARLYIGDHYLTDIIAGYAVGIAWFGLSFTYIEWLFKKYHLIKEKNK